MGPIPRLNISLSAAIRSLDECAGTGASGFRNSYLKVIVKEFSDPRARKAAQLLDSFAEAYVNVELPPWFYIRFSQLRLVAPIKKQQLEKPLPTSGHSGSVNASDGSYTLVPSLSTERR